MPNLPSSAQSEASRLNGARSSGPASDAGKARAALNGVHHGLSGRTFFLLADEDPAAFAHHEAIWLTAWAPRDRQEREAAEAAIRCMWRERADRLEALVFTGLFAAGKLPDPAEAGAAKSAAFKALNTLLRYRARIERERAQAMQALEALRQRRPAGHCGAATERTRGLPTCRRHGNARRVFAVCRAPPSRCEPNPSLRP